MCLSVMNLLYGKYELMQTVSMTFELEPITPESINRELLEELIETRMPFGRFQGERLIDLPEPYVVWFKQNGFPEGKIGQQLGAVYEIKVYGLEKLLKPLLNEQEPSAPRYLAVFDAEPDDPGAR